MWSPSTIELIRTAIFEDLSFVGDLSVGLLPEGHRAAVARIVSRSTGILSGVALSRTILDAFAEQVGIAIALVADSDASTGRMFADGDCVRAGACIGTLRGPQASLLTVERTLLNFIGRMSGVATLTRRYVDAARAANPRVDVLDTRKTLPGWRELDKYAVRCGGGVNHRFGLYDAVLIKDNHIAGIPVQRLAGALREMLARVPTDPPPRFIEIEVDSPAQLAEVLRVPGVDYVLLDNFPLDALREAVRMRDAAAGAGRPLLEASGGVTLDTIGAIAATGVDRISVGSITHSAPSLDFGLDMA